MIAKTLPIIYLVPLPLALSYQISPLALALAQSKFTPQPTWGSESVYIEGTAFYIQSGRPNGNQTWVTQAFSISFHATWAVNSPAYAPMPNRIDGHVYANTLLPDGVTWVAIRNSTYYTYNLSTGTLTQHAVVNSSNDAQALAAVSDPTTGELIIPAAYRPTPDANHHALLAHSTDGHVLAPPRRSGRAPVRYPCGQRKRFTLSPSPPIRTSFVPP
ncbi:hypothetical protein BGZ82_005653 [Podila clonocystis]|nr:hypothetical protein BGZ82_005653 [Podila clonocystis]